MLGGGVFAFRFCYGGAHFAFLFSPPSPQFAPYKLAFPYRKLCVRALLYSCELCV